MDNPIPQTHSDDTTMRQPAPRMPITPEVAKALAVVTPQDVLQALEWAQQTNNVLWALMVALPDNE